MAEQMQQTEVGRSTGGVSRREPSRATRIVFSFDDKSLATLNRLTKDGDFSSMAETVRVAIGVAKALMDQSQDGFTKIIVENPKTGKQREIIMPVLQSLQKN